MFLLGCVLLVSALWFYQMLKASFNPRTDKADVYRLPFGPMVMGGIFTLTLWIVLIFIPFSVFNVDLSIARSLWSMFFWISEVCMIFYYWKPVVNWIRKINGLPVGSFYEYQEWWC